MLDLWYKNAIIYCVDVDAFMDSNGDGVGDLAGLAKRLDHLEALGVTCLWLMPFYPSPNRDNGYDITDFYGVDPRLGSLGDFVELTRAARDRGLRVIVDFVANHTSIDHPWFQAARRSADSPYRDYYVWSKEKPDDIHSGVIFPGVQDAIWTYDEQAGAWYLHRFYEHQADLNIANPEVRDQIDKVMGFWLALGVAGFRVDAVPFLIEHLGMEESPYTSKDPHLYLEHLRRFLSWRSAEAMMLAEANIALDEADEYFGDGDRLQMIFNFLLNQNLYLALAKGDAAPIRSIMAEMPAIPEQAQWANFLRNHDELDLGRLSEDDRQLVYSAFGPEPRMQIYDRGIRRRLAPMLGGDLRKLKLAHSLMFALPGTPVLWYGDEIGMGDDLDLPERNSVRTPMQWSSARNAGFSTADAERLVRPVISQGPFAYAEVNVRAQDGVDGSLLEHVRRLIRLRRSCPAIGWGAWQVLECGATELLALSTSWQGDRIVTLHNLADAEVEASLPDDVQGQRLELLLGSSAEPADAPRAGTLRLEPFGYRWFRCAGER